MNYTQFIRNRISDIQSADELKNFLISNKENFNTWNNSALNTLNDLVYELTGDKDSKAKIDNLKKILKRKSDPTMVKLL